MAILRTLYYRLPTGLRFAARYLIYYPVDVFDKLTGRRDNRTPPKRMIYTGGGDFVKIGNHILEQLKKYSLITPASKVLDVGSGIGRMALPLTNYLTGGSYEGFDIIKSGIRWCQQHISSKFPNFRFTWIPLSNDLYINKGADARKFVFPYEDASFDLVIVISVFTHMLPGEVENYLKEISRVLKPGGHCYATFFILNAKTESSMSIRGDFDFKFNHGHYSLLDDKVKSANVAYRENYLDEIAKRNKLDVIEREFGSWSGAYSAGEDNFQDVVILKKIPDRPTSQSYSDLYGTG